MKLLMTLFLLLVWVSVARADGDGSEPPNAQTSHESDAEVLQKRTQQNEVDKKECEAEHMLDSCRRVAAFYLMQHDFDASANWHVKACELTGHMEECLAAGQVHDLGNDKPKAKQVYEVLCNKAQMGVACYKLAWLSGIKVENRPKIMRKACNYGYRQACQYR